MLLGVTIGTNYARMAERLTPADGIMTTSSPFASSERQYSSTMRNRLTTKLHPSGLKEYGSVGALRVMSTLWALRTMSTELELSDDFRSRIDTRWSCWKDHKRLHGVLEESEGHPQTTSCLTFPALSSRPRTRTATLRLRGRRLEVTQLNKQLSQQTQVLNPWLRIRSHCQDSRLRQRPHHDPDFEKTMQRQYR